MPSARHLPNGSSRSGAWQAALLVSALCHLALLAYLLRTKPWLALPDPAPRTTMNVRLTPAHPAIQPPDAPIPEHSVANRNAPRQAPSHSGTQAATKEAIAVTPAPAATPSTSPPSTESGPSTAALLNQITQGVLKTTREQAPPRHLFRQQASASQAETGRMSDVPQATGGRVERVQSPLGTYCVSTPNPATAYRNPSGVNIVGAGNCT